MAQSTRRHGAEQLPSMIDAALPVGDVSELYRAILRTMIEIGSYRFFRIQQMLSQFDELSRILTEDQTRLLLTKFDAFSDDVVLKELDGDKWTTLSNNFLRSSQNLGTKKGAAVSDLIRTRLIK
jgi:hypothetical protein